MVFLKVANGTGNGDFAIFVGETEPLIGELIENDGIHEDCRGGAAEPVSKSSVFGLYPKTHVNECIKQVRTGRATAVRITPF